MRYFSIFAAFLFTTVLYARSVSADAIISGRTCVIDGNSLQVGGKEKDQKCWGGIGVRLHGSFAPKINVTCRYTNGTVWNCGQQAKEALTKIIGERSISCYHLFGGFEDTLPVVTCISGRRNLAREMVVLGMAKALYDQSDRYQLEEKDAKRAGRGLWK